MPSGITTNHKKQLTEVECHRMHGQKLVRHLWVFVKIRIWWHCESGWVKTIGMFRCLSIYNFLVLMLWTNLQSLIVLLEQSVHLLNPELSSLLLLKLWRVTTIKTTIIFGYDFKLRKHQNMSHTIQTLASENH